MNFFEKLQNLSKKLTKEMMLYLIFGILTTVVNILSFYILRYFVNIYLANLIAWVVSVIFAFFTNKFFVFRSENIKFSETLREVLSFTFFRILSLIIDMVSLIILINLTIPETAAKLITQIIVVVLNYLFSKLFIFKN